MISDTPTLAQLIADYHSINTQVRAAQSKANDYTHLFNASKDPALQQDYQNRAVGHINTVHTLQARLSELEQLILLQKIPT